MTSISGGPVLYTPSVVAGLVENDINTEQISIANLQQQLATGNQVNVPSDNPTSAAQIMGLNSSYARSQQYIANAADAMGWLGTADSTVNQINSILSQVHQLMLSVSGSDLAGQQNALDAVAAQISNDRTALINLANTTYNSQPIFAGTGTTGSAYDSTGSYLGGGSVPTRTVADGVTISIGAVGPNVFGTGATGLLSNGTGTDPGVGVLAQTVKDLQAGNLSAVEGVDLSNFENAVVPVENQGAIMGANYQRAQEFSQQAQNLQATLDEQISALQDVNLAQATTQLQLGKNTYQSALWALSQSILPSLAQYLG